MNVYIIRIAMFEGLLVANLMNVIIILVTSANLVLTIMIVMPKELLAEVLNIFAIIILVEFVHPVPITEIAMLLINLVIMDVPKLILVVNVLNVAINHLEEALQRFILLIGLNAVMILALLIVLLFMNLMINALIHMKEPLAV